MCSVEKLDMDLIKGQEGTSLLHGPREASYGAAEAFIMDAGGHVQAFGEWKEPAST